MAIHILRQIRALPFLAAMLLGAVAVTLAPTEAREFRSRAVTQAFESTHPCPSTGATRGACPNWIKDHWIPLCAGGPDSVANLWWEAAGRSYVKDHYEVALCRALDHVEWAHDPADAAAVKAEAWSNYWSALRAMGGPEGNGAARQLTP